MRDEVRGFYGACFQYQPSGAVFAEFFLFFFFEDAEGFARAIKFYEFMDLPSSFPRIRNGNS
jgi:hypothetical protein